MTPIIAIDPGKVTGIAGLDQFGKFFADEVDGSLEFCDRLEGFLRDGVPVTVVIERYDITVETAKKSRQYAPLEIIGTARWMCHRYDHEFILSPRTVKAFSTDAKLKAAGWYAPAKTPGGHALDAARHLLHQQVTEDPTLRALLAAGL